MYISFGTDKRFQKRHKLTSKRVREEAASTNSISVKEGRTVLLAITQGFAKRDIYNMDETAFFYCTPPHKTVSTKHVSGRKNTKKRLTIAFTCNADDSNKHPLLFVGTARQPRCFDGKTEDQLGFDYASTKKGWMNTELFQRWARRFNDGMRAGNRHVLLLLENSSSHRLSEPLTQVTLKILPPNTNAYLQPQDAGIIQSFKTQVERLKTRYVVDKFDKILNPLVGLDPTTFGALSGQMKRRNYQTLLTVGQTNTSS
uniref:PREDICTED: tigger transposable element derived 6like putative n=1 Tax=Albugo laibachii Nc14 TaxID=890382 RepID=F0WUC3_9STRA|nr:PREDICTED: tigger transposable element derived 6like putative [Albugo laibachii Nc14]|eukprot:CCA25001.1 PREDICTED: tigger transposable element derived 6like putative [Albugo laibachii Nc14]